MTQSVLSWPIPYRFRNIFRGAEWRNLASLLLLDYMDYKTIEITQLEKKEYHIFVDD